MEKYIQGLLKKKEFEGLIFQYCLDNSSRFCPSNWNKEEYTDYLCWLYPRISRSIDRYREMGSSFDTYIRCLVRWSAKEYRSREADHNVTENACWNARTIDMMVYSHEPEPEYVEKSEALPAFKPVSNPRQVLVLLLKSYYFVSDDFLTRIAPAIGVKKEKLLQLIDGLRKRRLNRDEEIRTLQERIHCQFYRCISMTRRAAAAPAGSVFQEKIRQRLARAENRLAAMRKRLKNIRFEASNRQVAEVLGIPKGTVDSNLHALKLKRQKYDQEEGNSGKN
jgi:DNA-directed RNA polymerase specialized sigma24 family protein